jgi:SAM-dependent methyltransferase
MPLANALLRAEDLARDEPRYPLDLAFCRGCSLVQITETVPPERLFGDYVYFSSFSETMLAHARALVARMTQERKLTASSLVVEIASNDGYLLQYYRERGVPVLGIEPASNVAEAAEKRGVPTRCAFFGDVLARRLREEGTRADVLHAHNVLAHVPDLNGFVSGIGTVLADGGVAVIEVPYVKEMIARCEFDTIYHEHLCYFSLTALDRLFRRQGLAIEDVERLSIHGGSLRVFVGRSGAPKQPAVASLLADEAGWGVDSLNFYLGFSQRVAALKASLVTLLRDLAAQGKRIAAYGATAKGATLLNYAGIGREVLAFVADRSPHKQGRYLPGVHVPIAPPEALEREAPDYVLLLAWNLADEILGQQAEYRRRGGRFIIPVPEVRVL